jgi:hypothetical protein
MVELHHDRWKATRAIRARNTAEAREKLDLTEPDLRLGGQCQYQRRPFDLPWRGRRVDPQGRSSGSSMTS